MLTILMSSLARDRVGVWYGLSLAQFIPCGTSLGAWFSMRYVHVEAFCVWSINTQDSTHCPQRFFELIYLHDGEGADAWLVRLLKYLVEIFPKPLLKILPNILVKIFQKHSQYLSKSLEIFVKSLVQHFPKPQCSLCVRSWVLDRLASEFCHRGCAVLQLSFMRYLNRRRVSRPSSLVTKAAIGGVPPFSRPVFRTLALFMAAHIAKPNSRKAYVALAKGLGVATRVIDPEIAQQMCVPTIFRRGTVLFSLTLRPTSILCCRFQGLPNRYPRTLRLHPLEQAGITQPCQAHHGNVRC